jgi:hypothetical protein
MKGGRSLRHLTFFDGEDVDPQPLKYEAVTITSSWTISAVKRRFQVNPPTSGSLEASIGILILNPIILSRYVTISPSALEDHSSSNARQYEFLSTSPYNCGQYTHYYERIFTHIDVSVISSEIVVVLVEIIERNLLASSLKTLSHRIFLI